MKSIGEKGPALILVLFLAGCYAPRGKAPQFSRVEGAAPVKSALPQQTMQTVSLSEKIDPTWLKPPADLFTLGPGDRLEIEIIGDPASRVPAIVGPDGKIYYSILPGIDVWGSTLAQAKAKIEAELAKYVREKPQIGIVLRGVESQRIWILGRVQAPGVYAITTPLTLLEALSMAGGPMSLANYQDQEAAGINQDLTDLKRSFVIRHGKLLPIDFYRLLEKGDLSQNIYLQPDDFVYLPAANSKEVYVLGAVLQPRAVAWAEGMAVAGAVAGAFGTINGAYMHHVAVVRGSLTEPKIAIVDYRRVIQGEARDLRLEPGDIVYVPFSPYRYIDKYLQIVLNTFVSAAAINAGTQIVTPAGGGAAGVFIPVGSTISIIPPVAPPPIH